MKKLTAMQQRFFDNAVLIAALQLIFTSLNKFGVPVYPLSEIADTTSGGTPDRSVSEYYGGNIPWIKSGELNDGLIERSEEYITDVALQNSSAKVYPKGTLVVALYGATVGKTGILTIDAASNQAICAITPTTNRIGMNFLFWFLRYKRPDFLKNSFGGAQPNISQKILRETLIPIPAIDLQKEICSFLEVIELRQKGIKNLPFPNLPPPLSNLGSIVARIEELAAKIEEARGLRREAVEERELLISSTLSKFITHDITRTCKLDDICLQITDGEHATPLRIHEYEQGIPLVTAKNVRDGYLDLSTTDFVSDYIAAKCWYRCHPQHEDILMVCVGATTGRVCRLVNPPNIVIVRSVALLRPNKDLIDPKFLEYALESSDCQNQIWSSVKQAAQPCLYIYRMKQLTIPVPRLEEQHRIVSHLDNLHAKLAYFKDLQTQTSGELNALLPSILDKAFKGELS